jgi:hypothetical protein
MLKRGCISLALAALTGLLAYTAILETIVPAANISFFILLGFSVISFLFSLFEDEPEAAVVPVPVKTKILVVDAPKLAKVAP